eukprot:scaffold607_cov109-Cylindrotheca_fusiformis.AAC.7
MINIHKLGNYYITFVMLAIGGGYMYSPSTMMEAFNLDGTTSNDNNNRMVCQWAMHTAFTSDVTVGCVGLYSLIQDNPQIRKVTALAFLVDQLTFLWSAIMVMDKAWRMTNLFPVEMNVLIALLLLLVPEQQQQQEGEKSIKHRRSGEKKQEVRNYKNDKKD